MKRAMSATEARVHLGDVLRQVAEDDASIVIEHTGRPEAIAISTVAFERLGGRSELAEWMTEVDQLRAKYRASRESQPLPDIDELIDAGRDEWLDDLIDSVR